MLESVLITGGAGFVGSSLAYLFKEYNPSIRVVVFDNLRRRGAEINLPLFAKRGIRFVHGDVRNAKDFLDLKENFDLIIEASAEPSVLAGLNSSSLSYLLDTNLNGTLNCLEYARQFGAGVVFLSTSRVFSIPSLLNISLSESETRFAPRLESDIPIGLSAKGISENFPTVGSGYRSLYGSTKLASELFVEEYSANFGVPAVSNRCGVIAGPGQFGRTDQGVFTLWVARHFFGGELSYTGFGGTGKQVRDLLHPRDLFDLILLQADRLNDFKGNVFMAGGGLQGSVSLSEYTRLCEEATGRSIPIKRIAETSAVDIPWFIADSTRAELALNWHPKVRPHSIVKEIVSWLEANSELLKPLFNS